MTTAAKGPLLRRLHLASACLIGMFLVAHIGNHIVGLGGQQAHIDTMNALRTVYRHPLIEYPLLALMTWQIGSGLTMAVRGWRIRRGLIPWLQAGSGLYLAFFILNHVGAVLGGRTLLGLDTDFRFAAAGFHVPPWQWFFAPYYFFGVASLFVHIGCGLYWNLAERSRGPALVVSTGVGLTLGLAFVLMMAGALYPVDIPDAYRATYP